MASLKSHAAHERSFANLPTSVADARHWVLRLLRDTDEEVKGEIAIMVSELATNAVVHAGTNFRVRLQTDDDEIVRVSVSDGSSRAVYLRPPPTTDQLNGRGLRIVNEFAEDWGIEPDGGGQGKTVWFRIKAPKRAR